MRADVKVEMDFNLGNIKLNLSRELNQAGNIIKQDHFTRLERGMGVNGPMKNLAESTIIAKGFDQILVHTDKMRNLVMEDANKENQTVTLYPGKKQRRGNVTSQEIGAFHQEGGGNLPKREWFGITKKAENRCTKIIENRIDKILKSA